jgi:hypothetical protein
MLLVHIYSLFSLCFMKLASDIVSIAASMTDDMIDIYDIYTADTCKF